jgi:hypothetical protein
MRMREIRAAALVLAAMAGLGGLPGTAAAQGWVEDRGWPLIIEREETPLRPVEILEIVYGEGFHRATRPRLRGDLYRLEADDRRGRRVRLFVDAYQGVIVEIVALAEPRRRREIETLPPDVAFEEAEPRSRAIIDGRPMAEPRRRRDPAEAELRPRQNRQVLRVPVEPRDEPRRRRDPAPEEPDVLIAPGPAQRPEASPAQRPEPGDVVAAPLPPRPPSRPAVVAAPPASDPPPARETARPAEPVTRPPPAEPAAAPGDRGTRERPRRIEIAPPADLGRPAPPPLRTPGLPPPAPLE